VGDQREVLEGLQSGVTELALTFDLAISDRFHKLPLATLPPYALVPAHHRLANSSHVRLAELADEQFILMDLPHTREYFLSLFYSQHLEPHVHFRATSFETVRTLVGNGLGFSLLNLLPKHSLTYDGTEVVSLPISDPLLPLQIVLLTMKRVARRRIASSFQDFARSYLKTWREENSINPAVL
jgi:DNA-binding transcriptional LysR family regulator